jgi:hypothetical protein
MFRFRESSTEHLCAIHRIVPGCRDERDGAVEPNFLNVKIKANRNPEHADTNVKLTAKLDRLVLERALRGIATGRERTRVS